MITCIYVAIDEKLNYFLQIEIFPNSSPNCILFLTVSLYVLLSYFISHDYLII